MKLKYYIYILTDNNHLPSERERSRQIRILSVMLFYEYSINILLMYIGRNSCSCAQNSANYAQDLTNYAQKSTNCAQYLMNCAEKYANYARKFDELCAGFDELCAKVMRTMRESLTNYA